MNDKARLELERYLDDELPAGRQAVVARLLSLDHEARVYLDRLARLRDLARRHDPAAAHPGVRAVIPLPSRPRRHSPWAIAAAAVVASGLATIVWRNRPTPEAAVARNAAAVASPPQVALTSSPLIRTQDVALYTWANTAQRRPEPAVSALLRIRTRSEKRSAALEILAIDLANANAQVAGKLEPLALLHKPVPGGHGRNERHGRRTHPVTPGA